MPRASELSETGLVTKALRFLTVTIAALSIAIPANASISGSIFVPVPAMGPGALPLGSETQTAMFGIGPISPFWRENLIKAKTHPRPTDHSIWFHAGSVGKFKGKKLFSFDNNPSTSTTISHLLLPDFPSTVGCGIAQTVVNSSEGMRGTWLRSHVAGKSGKIPPFFADGNSAPTVILKALVLRISASAIHSLPSDVDRIGVHL